MGNNQMFSINTIFCGTVTCKDYLAICRHKNDGVDYIDRYHLKICDSLGAKFAYTFGSGRGALYSILKALKIENNDEVIIQGYTCVAVPKAVMYAGAKPIYADISKDDFNMTLESMKKVVSNRTKAVVVQHTYGIPCHEIDLILDYCHANGIYVIEDCAHTFGTKYNGRTLGTIGDAAFFSTDHSKYISTCVGGIAITNNTAIGNGLRQIYEDTSFLTREEVNAIIEQLRNDIIWHNKHINWAYLTCKPLRKVFNALRYITRPKGGTYWLNDYNNFEWPEYTFPGKLSNEQAFLGLSHLEKLEDNIRHRKEITKIYEDELTKTGIISSHNSDTSAPLLYSFLVDKPDELIECMRKNVSISRWFSDEILCIKPEEFRHVFFEESMCPNSNYITKHVVNLPTHPKVSRKEAKGYCKLIKNYQEKKNYCIKEGK